MSRLLANGVQYFADNVMMMMLAASISLVGITSIDKKMLDPLPIHMLSLLANVVLVVLARMACLTAWSCTVRSRDIFAHVLRVLPWFVRVAAVAFTAALLGTVDTWVGYKPSDPCGMPVGGAFLADAAVFSACAASAVLIGVLTHGRADRQRPNARLSTFLVELCYVSLLSATGKALHHTLRKITTAFHGPQADVDGMRFLAAQLCEQSFLTFLTASQLTCVLPQLRLAAQVTEQRSERRIGEMGGEEGEQGGGEVEDEASSSSTAYYQTAESILAYCWAYGLVDNLWWLLYTFVPQRVGQGWAGSGLGT